MIVQTLEKAALETATLRKVCDNYILIKELGRGSNGVVYLAHDTKLNRYVALKQLTLDISLNESTKEEIIYNFKREAIAIANLHHENIVNVYDIAQEGRNHFIVMEFIEGISLSKIIRIHELPLEMALNIAIQICDAVSYIHKNGVIHRDIKPDNIIFLGEGQAKLLDFGYAKLTDFGSAKFSEDTEYENNTGRLIGTILYMSPEQLQNSDDVDERADIYSLGVSLYEMLTGKLPFYGESVGEVVLKILTDEPELPSKANPGLPKCLDSIIMKALSKNAGNRYENITQFAEELKAFIEYKSYLEMTEMQFA
jgi:serine/threonine protein kinase